MNRSVKLLLAAALAGACAAEKVKSLRQAESDSAAQNSAAPAPAAPAAPPAPPPPAPTTIPAPVPPLHPLAGPQPTPAPPAQGTVVTTTPSSSPSAPPPVFVPAPAPTTPLLPLAGPQPTPAPPAQATVLTTTPNPAPRAPAQPIPTIALPADKKPGVSIQLRFRTGSVDDPPGKAGLTNLAARTMAEGGAGALDAKALLEALFPIAASVDVRVDREETTFTARVHRAALDKLLPILGDVLVKPRWDAKEFERIRQSIAAQITKSLRHARDEQLGKEALAELMYRGHPYGHLIEGHVADLKSITLEEAKAQAGRVFTLERLTIGVAGGYPNDLPERLQKLLAGLPAQGAPEPAVPSLAAAARHPRVLLVENQAGSTAISLGTPWNLSHASPDWAAMSVARSAFGEHRQFNGRLMQRLRELRGLNYGDYAYIEHFEQEGGDAAAAQTGRARHQQDLTLWLRSTQNENRVFALRAALYELARSLDDEPFTEAEVARTKGFLDGYLLLFDQTDARKLGYALDDAFYGAPDFLLRWRKGLDDVDAAQVNAAWKKWVHPEDLQIVLAGPEMAALKATLLSNAPTPIHYASGSQKPQPVLDEDQRIAAFPIGVSGEADVELVPVDKLFE